jgi:replicative DNA helicase
MRYHDFDFVGVDILHLIDHTEEKDLNRISRVLNQASKIAQVALVATVHLNRGRSLQAVRPRPVVTDIKGSSSFEQQADMVMFVHREQDVHGEPTDDGKAELFIAKGRNTRLGGVDVWLNPNTMRFQENSWL